MSKFKWWLAIVLGLVVCPQVWAQSLHVHGVLSRADDIALMMMFPAGTPFGFPNDYAISHVIDNPSGDGHTLTLTEVYTGEMTGPGMPNNIVHTPKGSLTVKGSLGTKTWTYTGNGVPPLVHMNETNVYTWDWESVCSEADMEAGTCQTETQPFIFCPMLGGSIFADPHGMEYENAITDFFVHSGQQGMLNVACTPESTPPDWPGPFSADDISDVDRTFRAQTGCYRYCLHPPCTGQFWTCPGATKKKKQIPNAPLLNCTSADKGFITGKNVTY